MLITGSSEFFRGANEMKVKDYPLSEGSQALRSASISQTCGNAIYGQK